MLSVKDKIAINLILGEYSDAFDSLINLENQMRLHGNLFNELSSALKRMEHNSLIGLTNSELELEVDDLFRQILTDFY